MQRSLTRAILLAVLAGASWMGASSAAACGADALGTSRTLTLKRAYGAWGANQHAPLPLAKGEVVLTFDDGPRPETTPLVLKALADQCVKATFFMVGDNIAKFPDLARRVAAEGHSTGMHSYTHPELWKMAPADQLADLKKTEDVYQATFGGPAPAYRFPFLGETPTMMTALQDRKVAVFSVDLGIGDWEADVTTEVLVKRLLDNLQGPGGGIILMHDAYGPPARAMPSILNALKANGYKVVHVEWEKAR